MDDEQVIQRVLQYEPRMRELEEQIERLARFIMDEVPGEPSQSQGAVDTAIRIIGQLQEELQYWNENYKGEQYVLGLEDELERLRGEVADWEALANNVEAENKRLRKEVERWKRDWNVAMQECDRLRLEVVYKREQR